MSMPASSAIYDPTYSLALLSALEKGNRVNIPRENRVFLDLPISSRYRRAALEAAVLIDKIELFGVHPSLVEHLDGADCLVNSINSPFDSESGAGTPPPSFLNITSRNTLSRMKLRINNVLKALGDDPIDEKSLSILHDSLKYGAYQGLEFVDVATQLKPVIDAVESLVEVENRYKDISRHEIMGPLAITMGEIPQADILADMFQMCARKLNVSQSMGVLSFNIGLTIAAEIWSSYVASAVLNTPIASALPISYKIKNSDDPNLKELSEAYAIFRVGLVAEDLVAPTVETIDDVLRLREDPSILRFRNILGVWGQALHDGDKNIVKEVKEDIIKANKEMKKLPKIRKAREILNIVSIPMSFLPIIGQIITGTVLATEYYESQKKKKYGWVTLGRCV